MKVAITGHTSGIGLALTKQCDNWIGFSRSNGFDINKPKPIVEEALNCDVFINNAHDQFAQIDLLYVLWEEWKYNKEKQIVCISSLRPDYNANRVLPYSVEKCALDHTCEQLQMISSPCRVINIKPGFVDTPRVADRNVVHKMDPNYIAEVILWSLKQPEYLMTLRIAPWNY